MNRFGLLIAFALFVVVAVASVSLSSCGSSSGNTVSIGLRAAKF